jgi:hypothetical protein
MHTQPERAAVESDLVKASRQFLENPAAADVRVQLDAALEAAALSIQDDQMKQVIAVATNHPQRAALRAALAEMSGRKISVGEHGRYEGILLTLPLLLTSKKPVRDLPSAAAKRIADGFHRFHLLGQAGTAVVQRWLDTPTGLQLNFARRKRLLIGMMSDALNGQGAIAYRETLPRKPAPPAESISLRYLTFSIQGYCDCEGLVAHWNSAAGAHVLQGWMDEVGQVLAEQGYQLVGATSPCAYSEAIVKGTFLIAQEELRLFCTIASAEHPVSSADCRLRVTVTEMVDAGEVQLVLEYLHGDQRLSTGGVSVLVPNEPGKARETARALLKFAEVFVERMSIGGIEVAGAVL